MTGHLPLILGMMAVTYLPRLLPLLFITARPLPRFIIRFLRYIPHTALSALIVRGVMQTSNDLLAATFAGLAAAVISSWLKGSLVVSVIVSILASFIVLKL